MRAPEQTNDYLHALRVRLSVPDFLERVRMELADLDDRTVRDHVVEIQAAHRKELEDAAKAGDLNAPPIVSDPPKTDPPADPPKTDPPADPPKTDPPATTSPAG